MPKWSSYLTRFLLLSMLCFLAMTLLFYGLASYFFDDVSISADGKQSFYRIYCVLDSDHLTLKNGFKGFIKKGMVVNANFIVASRTVFQLIYDKVDNWLNPEIQKERYE